ncbi:MAG: sodium-independent anion transporter [Xanthobacteraceae bacterium]
MRERVAAKRRGEGFLLQQPLFSAVPLIDGTGARALHGFVHKLQRSGTRIYFSGAGDGVRRTLTNAGLKPPDVLYSESIESAKTAARESG